MGLRIHMLESSLQSGRDSRRASPWGQQRCVASALWALGSCLNAIYSASLPAYTV